MVLKSEIQLSFDKQQLRWHKKEIGLMRESFDKSVLTTNSVLIITGVRRCGKSTLMNQISQRNNNKSIWFNFEDSRIFGFELSDFPKLDEIIGEQTEEYFFDEIQNVENWEIFIRELYEDKNKICITGSNASLLSKELGTKLTGRNIQVELFPFSYQEYCQFFKLKFNESSLKKYLDDGGFPDYLKHQNKDYLQQLFKDIVYRDIIVRHGIRNANLFIEIALFLISNVGKEYSLNQLKKTFKVGSTNSVANYVNWLEDAYLLFSIPRFSWSLKSVAINPKKVYSIDTGFIQANSLSFTKDSGRLLENLLFLELRRKHKDIYYFKQDGECDFIVKEGKEITHILQVCAEINSDNIDREVNGLVEALQFFKKTEGTIITFNQEDVIEKDSLQIKLIPAFKWLEKSNN